MLNCLMLSSLLCFPAFFFFSSNIPIFCMNFFLLSNHFTDEMGQRAIIGRMVGDVSPPGLSFPPELLPETIAEAEENTQRCDILL